MKVEEALEFFFKLPNKINLKHFNDVFCDKYDKSYECISKSLEKQIQKKIEFDESGLNVCPVCKNYVSARDNYCKWCGQKLFLK